MLDVLGTELPLVAVDLTVQVAGPKRRYWPSALGADRDEAAG